jgi:hypothetical protein
VRVHSMWLYSIRQIEQQLATDALIILIHGNMDFEGWRSFREQLPSYEGHEPGMFIPLLYPQLIE